MSWLVWLFDSSPYMPRHLCGHWPPGLRVAWQAANAVIALAYFIIPACVGVLWHGRRNDLGGMWRLLLIGSFILLCGLTHVTEIAVFYWPAYRLYTLLYALTGLVSIVTAAVLPSWVAVLLKLPSRKMLHDAKDRAQQELWEKEAAYLEMAELNTELTDKLGVLEVELARRVWREDNAQMLRSLLGEMKDVVARHRPRNGVN